MFDVYVNIWIPILLSILLNVYLSWTFGHGEFSNDVQGCNPTVGSTDLGSYTCWGHKIKSVYNDMPSNISVL